MTYTNLNTTKINRSSGAFDPTMRAWRGAWQNGYRLSYPVGERLVDWDYLRVRDTDLISRAGGQQWDWEH